jgi:hypothetical protein
MRGLDFTIAVRTDTAQINTAQQPVIIAGYFGPDDSGTQRSMLPALGVGVSGYFTPRYDR